MDMTIVSDENVQMILAMGFPSESEVRRALRMAKNDLGDAVAILTNEPPTAPYSVEVMDIDLKDVRSGPSSSVTYGPHLPPTYDEVCNDSGQNKMMDAATMSEAAAMEETNSLEFPVTNLYELEGRVFTENWNIPFKKEESLGKCLIASTRLMEAGLAESDEHCLRFVDRCMPEAFQKLLTSNAVHKWGIDIQEGIFNMLGLLVELAVASLKQPSVHSVLMECLTLAFNPETEFQIKNHGKRDSRITWEERFEGSEPPAIVPPSSQKTNTSNQSPFGWLTNLINSFAYQGGFDLVRKHLEAEDLDIMSMSLLLKPFGVCAEYLNQNVMQSMLRPGMERAIKYIQSLEEKDFKEKKIGSVSNLLSSMKLLCLKMWPQDVDKLDDLRLEITLRMLKSPHFNAKMNALKEVTKLIEDLNSTRVSKTSIVIPAEKILDWLVENRVLSIALEGNIDQAQYCDKIKGIVDFLGAKLSVDELAMIWKMQNGQTNNVIDNIHSIIAAAAVKFDPNQLEHLFLLIQKKWQDDSDRIREKLLSLIGKIGKDAKLAKTTTRVLELLWDLAHLPALSTLLVEQALEEHHAILSYSYSVKEQVKLQYVTKCVDDIKKGACVLPAIRQLMSISKNMVKHFKQKTDKCVINELNKSSDVIKLVTNSLVKCHKQAVAVVGDGQLTPATMVDGRYPHSDYMSTHLNFLQYVLQEGVLYLAWNRARDIWTTLVANPKACEWDIETCYEWFRKGITDLEIETQNHMFQKEVLRIDPSKLSENGFMCFKCFFERVNQYEHRLKDTNSSMVVEKPDLVGLDYLWEICLHVPDEGIADQAIQMLLALSYTNLNSRLKREPVSLHKKFINECYTRLETAMLGMGGNFVAQTVSNATKIVTAAIVPDVANVPLPSKSINYLAIERLLWIAEAYILSVEEIHCVPRNILPHGASFHGFQMNILVKCESPKQEFMLQCHSNETLGSVRRKILNHFNQPSDHVQMHTNEKLLSMTKDQLLLSQLDFSEASVLQVHLGASSASKSGSTSAAQGSGTGLLGRESESGNQSEQGESQGAPGSSNSGRSGSTSSMASVGVFSKEDSEKGASSNTSKQNYDIEQEKMLPGVVMAKGGEVFDKLYQLTELDEPKITKRVQKLLMLIPTDPAVSDSLDLIGHKSMKSETSSTSSSEELSGAKSSPRKVVPSSLSNPRLSPKEAMKYLFDSSQPDMSAFRVLYNLEVLSSKLMPTSEEPSLRAAAQSFCTEFLLNGGLSLVVSVLQPESLPPEINYEIRQGCYSICLQLARYLLCGQTVTGGSIPELQREESVSGPAASASAAADLKASPSAGGASSGASNSNNSGSIINTSMWSQAVQTLSTQEFVDTVSCFMKVTWAAAAGRLHLLSYNQPIKESRDGFGCGHRSRQSSTGSSASTNSDSDCQSLHAGVCSHQVNIPTKDANIAREALEILITCLQLRKELLASFYTMPCVSDFILDLLVGCPLANIRNATLAQLVALAQLELSSSDEAESVQTPRQFILQLLLKAYLPFWVTSSNVRGTTQKLLTQCSQYFELRCRLLENLSLSEQKKLNFDVNSMLEDEIAWLSNFVPSRHTDLRQTDNTLLAGHLKLIRTLLTCEGVDKVEHGSGLVSDLLHDFLFPASKLMLDSMNQTAQDHNLAEFNPKCSNSESRVAAHELLAELSNKCLASLQLIGKELLMMHHQLTDNAKEWEYMPPVDGRAACGYVGLKNGGATCYMNSVLQQLYMTPGIPEAVLSVDEDEPEEDSVFYQIQLMFGHLMESRLQYHEPEKFWSVFKLWGHTVNIREQQDSFDFFQAVLDQIDEHMKASGKGEIFKKKFQGIFSDQKICKDCPHRYEREEAFIALNLTVKNATLQDSLEQFVKGELLEGANAYFCEKCGEKRNAIKRMCIKSLPPMLCIQLKRFGYDWEANRALKFDDYFKFPWTLDMEPYTVEGMARREGEQAERSSLSSDTDGPSSAVDGEVGMADLLNGDVEQGVEAACIDTDRSPIHYDLVGIVVHSGQANAGHYYSYIRDRRGTVLTNPNKGKWFKFNDTVVEEFDMNDMTVEQECFGGSYKAKVYDSSSTYPEERLRYWNGYLLFYERIEDLRSPVTAKRSKIISRRVLPEGGKRSLNSDSLMELTELVHKGERKGIFLDRMPAAIQQVIHAENITFVKNRDIYNPEYFSFVRQLVSRNKSYTNHPDYEEMCIHTMQLSTRFLFNTYLRTRLKTQAEMDEWVNLLDTLMSSCKAACLWLAKAACLWLADYLASAEGSEMVKPFILECPTRDVRVFFSKILERMLHSFFQHDGVPVSLVPPSCVLCCSSLKDFVLFRIIVLSCDNVLLSDHQSKGVVCLCIHIILNASFVLFPLQGTKACAHMFGRNGFIRLITFLLGNGKGLDSGSRRWSSIQTREFAHLHTALALLILNCDVQAYQTHPCGEFPQRKPVTVLPSIFLKMSPEMSSYVFGEESQRYIKEVVMAVRELAGGNLLSLFDMLLYCSFCNEKFTETLLKQIMWQYSTVPSNELKPIFSLLTQILTLEDPLQTTRLQLVIDGFKGDDGRKYEGLQTVIRHNHVSDSRRSYQCIKFLVSLMNKSAGAKDFLLNTPSKWQWAVDWLTKKMNEYFWSSTTTSMSNEDSNRKSFQRTQSAQYTLQEATALLTERESHEFNNNSSSSNGNSNGGGTSTEPGPAGSSVALATADYDNDVNMQVAPSVTQPAGVNAGGTTGLTTVTTSAVSSQPVTTTTSVTITVSSTGEGQPKVPAQQQQGLPGGGGQPDPDMS
ncbi:LOW QUALITY PROTEIN: ubiquitin carboxyl-terminal hydrolase 24 [Aplysia californica]|uniref:LOW QUALITY PROTEIN: ubiquitin carboxyl-terminal hydrolase 24 n=1 Tax=Aplysia californica TaxID=6500 RepID=A0ABM1W1P7_APLCA|nr:LOW QUALITY PROTEIN: ubiquitin carboxyl-terminal hydrolase 24 [Aplysia californica]